MSERRWIVIALSIAGIVLASASFAQKPALIWNFSESAPLGLYVALDRPWKKGDWVAVRPGPKTAEILQRYKVIDPERLLVKRVAAMSGDVVCRSGAMVTINGTYVAWALPMQNGRALPKWQGCKRLAVDDILLLGAADKSFDGRYFGVTQGAEVLMAISHIL